MKLKKKDIKTLKRLRKHCTSIGDCKNCIFLDKDHDKCFFSVYLPISWEIEKLEKLLDE